MELFHAETEIKENAYGGVIMAVIRWRFGPGGDIFNIQWIYGSRASIAKITSRFHDWVIERMIMSSTEIRTTEGEL